MLYFTPRLGCYRGGVLERFFFALREELLLFTIDEEEKKMTWLLNQMFLLAFVADIFWETEGSEREHPGEIHSTDH